MNDNHNFPIGADDSSAPWNSSLNPEVREFDVYICQCISKDVKLKTDEYTLEEDEDGHTVYNLEDTDWDNIYRHSEHYTIEEILAIFKGILNKLLKEELPESDRAFYENLLRNCEGWVINETDVNIDSLWDILKT